MLVTIQLQVQTTATLVTPSRATTPTLTMTILLASHTNTAMGKNKSSTLFSCCDDRTGMFQLPLPQQVTRNRHHGMRYCRRRHSPFV